MDFNGYLMSGEAAVAEIKRGRITPVDPARMPLYLAAHDDLDSWIEGRAIDRHRTNSRILKKVLRLTDSSDAAAVLRAHAATIGGTVADAAAQIRRCFARARGDHHG